MRPVSDQLLLRDQSGTVLRRWLILGLFGLFLLLCAEPFHDAWVLNRASVLVNRAIVADSPDAPSRTGEDAVNTATHIASALRQAKALMQEAAREGAQTGSRQTHIWRTYGAAAALSPSNDAFALLAAAGDNGWLDRVGQLWLGEVATATGHIDAATDAYRRIDASNLLISQGDAHLESGEKELAAQQYRLARISLDAAMQREYAESLLQSTGGQGHSLTAGLMTSDAERVTELYRIGKGLLAAGQADDALPTLEDALQRSDDASPGAVVEQSLRLNLALALAKTLPDPPSSFAVTHVSYYPENGPMTYLQIVIRIRGLVYTATKSDLTASVCVQAARTLLLVGDDENAVALLQKAIKLDTLMADAYLMLGDWYESKGMYILPYDLYRAAIKQLPSDTRIAVAYALAAYRVLSPYEALPILQRTAQTSTDDPYLFACLGDCYLRLGMIAGAHNAYEDGLRRTPNADPLVQRLDELDKAVKVYR